MRPRIGPRLGCRRIAFLALPQSAATVDARVAGYREALYDCGAATGEGLVAKFDPAEHEVLRERPKGTNETDMTYVRRELPSPLRPISLIGPMPATSSMASPGSDAAGRLWRVASH